MRKLWQKSFGKSARKSVGKSVGENFVSEGGSKNFVEIKILKIPTPLDRLEMRGRIVGNNS